MLALALAFALEDSGRVAVSFIGEGGSSLGEWHEAINVCAARRLPAVFCVQNNQTALSTPLYEQSSVRVFADKARGYGIPGLTLDGTDPEAVAADMASELGEGNAYPDLLQKLARFEVALLQFREEHLGASEFGIFANKCWPAFEKHFGFVPCYVNSRLAARGIPVACEVDIWGALSEYLGSCATEMPVTLLDINNTV